MYEGNMYYHPKYEQWEGEPNCCHKKKQPKLCNCKPMKKCLKTFDCTFKLYRISFCRLYKVCQSCSHEYDFHHHGGVCPKCGAKFFHANMDMEMGMGMMEPE